VFRKEAQALFIRFLAISLLPQQGLDVPAAPENMENQHVLVFDAIDDDLLAHGKTA
jgi:hypothetical protein